MKILFVEDNEGFAGDLKSALLEIPNIQDVVTVRDKESAVGGLNDDLIDLIVGQLFRFSSASGQQRELNGGLRLTR